MDCLVNVKQLSEMLGFKPAYVRKLVQEGQIPYYKPFGKKIFFKKSEINELLQGQRVPSVAELIDKIN